MGEKEIPSLAALEQTGGRRKRTKKWGKNPIQPFSKAPGKKKWAKIIHKRKKKE